MESQDDKPFGDATNNAYNDERLNKKKPVGYGSSTQSDGTGNHTRPVDKSKAEDYQIAKNEEQSTEDAETGHA